MIYDRILFQFEKLILLDGIRKNISHESGTVYANLVVCILVH